MTTRPVKSPNETSYILENQTQVEDAVTQLDTEHLVQEDGGSEGSTLPYASFNYINSIIGSGVIGIPYALNEAGFALGLILLILVAVVTDYSLVLMVRSAHISGTFSYQGIMQSAFGSTGYFVLSILQFLYPFIAMISYNVVVGDTVTKVIIRLLQDGTKTIFSHRELVVGLTTIFITIPLCLFRDISRLSKVSFVSLLCVAFILLAIIIRIGPVSEIVPNTEWSLVNKHLIPAVAIMAFAFMCHHNTFLVYGSMKGASQQKWNKVTHISVFTSFIVTAAFGIAGYATFTSLSQGDLLENYCWSDDLMNAARIVFSFTILLTYPIEFFVTRDVIENLISMYCQCTNYTKWLHYILTLSIILLAYLISMSTDCLGIVLELNGVLAAVPLAYILPALIYIKLEEGPFFSCIKLPAIILAFIGIFIAIAGIVMLITDFREIDTCSHGKVMPYCNMTG